MISLRGTFLSGNASVIMPRSLPATVLAASSRAQLSAAEVAYVAIARKMFGTDEIDIKPFLFVPGIDACNGATWIINNIVPVQKAMDIMKGERTALL